MWHHPKYYKELRKRNKETQQELQRILDKPGRSVSNSDQTISLTLADGCNGSVHPGPGQQLGEVQPWDREATPSYKPQATSSKHQANQNQFRFKLQASSDKPETHKHKRQASSRKQQAP